MMKFFKHRHPLSLFKNILNFYSNSSKIIISSIMEQSKETNKSKRLITPEEEESLFKIATELGISDKNMPEVSNKGTRTLSFGGRVRIAALTATDAEKWIDKVITVGGWARTLRLQGGGDFAFIDLNDGSTIKNLQIVVSKDLLNYAEVIKEGIGSCFQLRGLVVKSPGTKQPIELQVDSSEGHFARVLGPCDQGEYPLTKGKDARMKLETLRDICHLRPRTNVISTVARIRNNLAYATHLFFQSRGFIYVHTPIITGADCEGAGEMFQVTTLLPKTGEKVNVPQTKSGLVEYKDDFFGKPAFLTVSGQLAVENFAVALSDVYTFGPTFRAEDSHTSRHLAEFWMIEPEMCFADIQDDMECAENYLKYCLKYILENNKDDLEFLDKQVEKGIIERLKNVTENEFKKLSYTEAIEILADAVKKDPKLFKDEKKKEDKKEKKDKKDKKKEKKDGEKKEGEKKDGEKNEVSTTVPEKKEEKKEESSTVITSTKPQPEKKEKPKDEKRNIFWGMDMASEHERYLTEEVFKKPTIVYNYPKEIKSFYMRQNEDGKTVAAMDILVPKIGEIIGGSQREERLQLLEDRIKELGMDVSSYWWYLELRKFGSVPHCGFGLGFERLVMMATGLENIRDVIPYPRYPGHAEF